MRQLTFLLSLLALAWSAPALGQPAITQAISSGDANALGQHFGASVQVGVAGKEGMHSKAQAIGVVRDFFAQNPVRQFTTVHQAGASSSEYVIGNLVTANGTFRVYVYMSLAGGKHLIQELRFDRQ